MEEEEKVSSINPKKSMKNSDNLIDCASNHKELDKFITKLLKGLKVEYDVKLIERMNIKEKYKLY
jgi:hypothetical protein